MPRPPSPAAAKATAAAAQAAALAPGAACNCAALREAARHVSRFYDETLAPAGLSLNQYSILTRLDRAGPCNLQELAALLVMDRSTLGHLLRPLQGRGLAALGRAAADRRERVVSLTEEGAALLRRARPLWAAAEKRFEDVMGRADAAALRAMLGAVAAAPLAGAP